jgi:hypothetical protein
VSLKKKKSQDFTACCGGTARLCRGIAARDTEVEIQEEGKEVNREGCDKASVASSSAVEGKYARGFLRSRYFFVCGTSGGTDAMTIRCSDSRK